MKKSPETMSVPQVRKNLQETRIAWGQNSPTDVFYPSQKLTSGYSIEDFAYRQVQGSHAKRHSKSKSSSAD